MLSRYASAITTSTIMTLGLLYIMQSLIALQPGVVVEPRIRATLPLVTLKERDAPLKHQDPIIDPEKLTENLTPPTVSNKPSISGGIGVYMPTQTVLTGPLIQPNQPSDGPLVSMIKVAPNYPINATSRGLEGHVLVEFDVDANGRVVNVRVLESSHTVFEREAIKAAERFKYKPRVVNGVSIATTGVRNLFTFELENS